MKVLTIVPFPIFPPDDGGRSRTFNLLKYLARDHEVVLFTPRSPGNARAGLPLRLYETTPSGRRHQVLSPGFLLRAPKIVREERPDVILIEHPWSGIHAAYLARRFGVPFVLDAPNVEAARFRSTGSRAWRFVAAYERLVTRMASRVFVVSEEDRRRFVERGVAAAKIAIVPNGVDPEVMHPDAETGASIRRELGVDDATRLLFFFGQLDYAPNREALAIIAREVLPRLDASGEAYRVAVAGKGDAGVVARHPRVRVLGTVPSVAPYINAADVVLAPITSGGGTRIKILESIACGTPALSTELGAEGIDRAVCGDLLAVCDGWDAFTARLLAEAPVKAGNVPAGFLDMYSWARIVERIEWP